MSLYDLWDNFKFYRDRYMWPVIFLVVGLILMSIASSPKTITLHNGETMEVAQDAWFMYAALFFILGAVVWTLYLVGLIKSFVGYGVMAIMLALSVFILWKDFSTIKKDVDYKNAYDQMNADIIQRMMDLKEAQLAYKEFNGVYTSNMDELINFVKTGQKMKIKKEGSVPERKISVDERDYLYGDDRPIDKLMTEEEAYRLATSPNPPSDLAEFRRDTTYIPVLDALFHNEKYEEARRKSDASIAFHPDSLAFVPFSSNAVKLDTASVLKGEFPVPTLQITMVHPLEEKKVYQIGDVNDNHLRENWKN